MLLAPACHCLTSELAGAAASRIGAAEGPALAGVGACTTAGAGAAACKRGAAGFRASVAAAAAVDSGCASDRWAANRAGSAGNNGLEKTGARAGTAAGADGKADGLATSARASAFDSEFAVTGVADAPGFIRADKSVVTSPLFRSMCSGSSAFANTVGGAGGLFASSGRSGAGTTGLSAGVTSRAGATV